MAPGSTFGKSGAAPDAATCHMPGVATRRGVTNPRVDSIKNYGNKNFVSRRGGKKTIVQVATWNVRSLVNFSGPAGTAFVRQEFSEKNLSRKDDRRIDTYLSSSSSLSAIAAQLSPVHGLDCCSCHCPQCRRCFKSAAGFRRHNCRRGSGTADRDTYQNVCGACGRRFRFLRDLKRHRCVA